MGGEERGSSPRENLAASGSYTSLFISSYLKNFHIKHNEQKMLCWAFWPPFKGEDSLVGGVDKAGEAGWLRFGVDTFVCVCKKKRGERTESLGRSRVWGGKRGGVGTSHVEGRRECQLSNTSSVTDSVEGKTIPCWTPLIKNTIAHAIMQKTHSHATPAFLPPPALIESSLRAIRYLLFSPAKSNLLIFPECLSLSGPSFLSDCKQTVWLCAPCLVTYWYEAGTVGEGGKIKGGRDGVYPSGCKGSR